MPSPRAAASALVLAAAALAACAHAPGPARYRNLEVRLVSESGGEPFQQWGQAGALRLEPVALFTGGDFASIAPSSGGDDGKAPSLALRFDPAAARRFEEATTRFSGRRMAVVVDGRVVTAPKILHPISTGLFEITGPSREEIDAMYDAVVGPTRDYR